MSSNIRLSELAPGKKAIVKSLEHEEPTKRRLGELGFCPGQSVEALFRALFDDPTAYRIQNAVIALRRSEAERIYVKPI